MKNVNLQMSMFLHITLAAEIDPTEGPTYKWLCKPNIEQPLINLIEYRV
jgi:hypothetical protein